MRAYQRLLLPVAATILAAAARPAGDQDLRLPAEAFPAAARLHQAGKTDEALALVDRELQQTTGGDVEIAARLLRARLLSANRRHGDSAVAWEQIGEREASVRRVARRSAFENWLSAGEIERAAAILGQITHGNSGRDDTDLMLALAGAYRGRKACDVAIRLFERVLDLERDSTRRDEAHLGLAATLEIEGEIETALDVLRRAEIEHRDGLTFLKARAEETRLARRIGRTPAPFTCREALPLAVRLRREARFREAIDLLEPCRRTAEDTASAQAIDVEIVTDLYLLRDNDGARARAARFLADFPASRSAGAIRTIQLRLAVREGLTSQARALGLLLWRDRSPTVSGTERRAAVRLLGAYLVSIGEVNEGLSVYRELVTATVPKVERIDVLWRAGVAAVGAGRDQQARSDLGQALALRPGPDTAPLLTYWLAVAEAALGRSTLSRRLLGTLAEGAAYSYYGMRARERLGRQADVPGEASRSAPVFPAIALRDQTRQHPDYRAASLLALAGLAPEAAGYARRLARLSPADQAVALVAARASAAAGDYHDALGLVATHFNWLLQRPVSGLPADLWSLAYPKAFWNEVESSARAAGVDPLLLLAIARQESGFDPRARSDAGAVGLFQVMPETANALAPAAGVSAPDEDSLRDPVTNARLAAVLVARLLAQFDGAVAPAVASFNAGEDRVAVWWQACHGREDLFVDSIPYNETRRYAREVLAGYAVYRRLYGSTTGR